jgi:5-enolpyruvylshikimate-3-phosphate synthase
MTFEETQKTIKEFMESNQNIINEDQCKSLNEILDIIYEDIKSLTEAGEGAQITLDFKELLDAIVGISQIVLTSPLSDGFSVFILAFSELVFNWNKNTYKDSTVSVLVKFMTNIINSRNDMAQTTANMKMAKERLQIMSNWSPAAFEVSLAYVDEQLKINEEQKGVV